MVVSLSEYCIEINAVNIHNVSAEQLLIQVSLPSVCQEINFRS